MRRSGRSPSYSPPPRRGYGGRRSPSPRGPGRGYGGRRDPPTSLLVRNIPRDCRSEDLRVPFERYGPVKDVYLPKDYYTGEPRGFGFVQYLDPADAAEAQYHMDRRFISGREITVVFAEENRKKPAEMRTKERTSSYRDRSYGSTRRRSPGYGRSRSRSPRYYSPSPRRRSRYDRSYSPSPVRGRDRASRSPASRGYSASPVGKGRGRSPPRKSSSPPGRAREPSTNVKGNASRSPSHSPPSNRLSRSPPVASPARARRQRSPSPPPRMSLSPEPSNQRATYAEGSPHHEFGDPEAGGVAREQRTSDP